MSCYVIYTDGACKNDGSGGWAFLVKHINALEIGHFEHGSDTDTTSNQMELRAVERALMYIKEHHNSPQHSVIIVTDSKNVEGWCALNWQINVEGIRRIVTEIKELTSKLRVRVSYKWIKGHSGNEFNDYVDILSRYQSLERHQDAENYATKILVVKELTEDDD